MNNGYKTLKEFLHGKRFNDLESLDSTLDRINARRITDFSLTTEPNMGRTYIETKVEPADGIQYFVVLVNKSLQALVYIDTNEKRNELSVSPWFWENDRFTRSCNR